jgi:hypothetical protein
MTAAFTLAALAILPPTFGAEAFRLDWSTVDGGGGISRGGEFSLAGTIGQADAAVARGGGFVVESGYWQGVSIERTAGAPVLKIGLTPGGQVILSWPLNSAGFVLEQTSALGTTWMPTLRPILDTATEHTVTVPASGPLRCYRLRRAQP